MQHLVFFMLSCALAYSVEGCCIPDQWEGIIGEVGEVARRSPFRAPKVFGLAISESYDATNQKMAFGVTLKNKFVKTIADYPAKKYYVVTNTSCKYFELKDPFHKGCTDNLTFSGNYVIGALDATLMISSWVFKYEGLSGYVSVTKDGCIPIGEGFGGKAGRRYMVITLGYTNITAGIKDPSIFTPPASCEPGTEDIDIHLDNLGASQGLQYLLKTRGYQETEKPKDKYLKFGDDMKSANEIYKHLI